jgi:hypothetical protein
MNVAVPWPQPDRPLEPFDRLAILPLTKQRSASPGQISSLLLRVGRGGKFSHPRQIMPCGHREHGLPAAARQGRTTIRRIARRVVAQAFSEFIERKSFENNNLHNLKFVKTMLSFDRKNPRTGLRWRDKTRMNVTKCNQMKPSGPFLECMPAQRSPRARENSSERKWTDLADFKAA